MTGRWEDPVWQHFIKIKDQNKPARAQCKRCKSDMCALVSRMKVHVIKCNKKNTSVSGEEDFDISLSTMSNVSDSDDNSDHIHDSDDLMKMSAIPIPIQRSANKTKRKSYTEDPESPISQSPSCSSALSGGPRPSLKRMMADFVTKTSKTESAKIDIQIARFIYSTNSSFRIVEHEEFKKMIDILRPGYKPPNRRQIGNELLDAVYSSVQLTVKNNLKNKTVCMAMDGWSNIHNEPIVCVSLTDLTEGNIHLIDTIDTIDNKHTGNYLKNLAVNAIKNCNKFNCSVRSFVTDNAANMKAMRNQLAECAEIGLPDIITYGCSAHLLNLFAKDIDVPGLKDNVKYIIKHFRNVHFVAAKYRLAGGTSLILPQDVRWNSLADCFDSYLKNWHILSKICSENRVAVDTDIFAKIHDLEFKISKLFVKAKENFCHFRQNSE